MPPAPAPPTRRRHLTALLALLTLLLAFAVVAASHLYWQELRGEVDQLHQALALARGQQQDALERLRDAGASLAVAARQPPPPQITARLAQPDSGSGTGTGSGSGAGAALADPNLADPNLPARLARAAADVERLAAALAAPPAAAPTAVDWQGAEARVGLQRELNALAREAMHLPPMRYLPPPGRPTPPLLLHGSDLRALLRQGEDAAALGDFALVARQVLTARRFLGYYQQEPRAIALARRLEALHARLQESYETAGDQARLQRLAGELRALARQLPAAPVQAPAR